ncbi:MAG TPA: hypothetical protein PKD55_11615 [Bellilinea sp.]|nr:hypothetical protein [Bellilinea sp.]
MGRAHVAPGADETNKVAGKGDGEIDYGKVYHSTKPPMAHMSHIIPT